MDDLWRDILVGAAGDGSGGLAAAFAVEVVRGASRRIRERFTPPQRTDALWRTVATAFLEALGIPHDLSVTERDRYSQLFKDWLLHPAVLGEFRKLLTPGAQNPMDLELLREEFEATEWSTDFTAWCPFETFIKRMVAAFYRAVAEESTLCEVIRIDLLRQTVEHLGALDDAMRRQVVVSEQAVDHLDRLRYLTERLVLEQVDTNELLQYILQVLTQALQAGAGISIVAAYHESMKALDKTGLLPAIDAPLAAVNSSRHDAPALAQILAMLDNIHTQLVRTADGPDPAILAELEAHYRQSLIEQFKNLTFEGLQPSGVPISLPLERIYVELKSVADMPEAADTYSADERRLLLEAERLGGQERDEVAMHLDALHAEHLNRQARQNMERLQRRSIQELLESPVHRGVVILGDPGAGKSTLLRYQALRAARVDMPTGSERACLPIFVPLAAYDDYTQRLAAQCTLGDFLAIYYDKWHSLPGLAPVFQNALEEGRALLLLDGLDEVLDAVKRQFVAAQVEALMRQWAPRGNRFAITSRIVGYREARVPGDLPHVTILDFGRPEMMLFAQQWCRTYEVWVAGEETATALQRATTEAQMLLHDVQSNPSVERLAASPLLLTMLALLRRHVGQLPDRRIDLYASYVRTLLDNWQITRSRGARQHMPDRFDPHMAIALLIELAFWLQQHKPSGTARRQELEQVLEDICLRFEGHDPAVASPKEHLQAQQTTTRFLRDMRQFAGLLAERGRDAFGFLHLTFQEYFAGRALARLSAEQRWAALAPHLHRPRWREPILLCAGQLGVLEQRRDEVSDLAERILQAQNPYETILHRDLFFAAAFAADDVGLSNPLLDALASQLRHLQDSNIPTVRDTVLGGMAQLARLGNEEALGTLLEALQNPGLRVHVIRGVKTVLHAEACATIRQAIVAKLDDEVEDVRRAAVQALAGLVASEAEVRQAIVAKLDDARHGVRQAAVQALAGLVGDDTAVRQAIVAKLTDSWYHVRQAAVQALEGLVVSDAGMRQTIVAKLDDEAEEVRQAAVLALAGLVTSDAEVRQAIVAKLNDAWYTVRQAAVLALAGLVTSDAEVRQAIVAKLDDVRYSVRQAAVLALAGLVVSDTAVHQAIVAKLDDEAEEVRQAAVQTLAVLIASDAAVCQAIVAKLDDEWYEVRPAAVLALAGLVASDAGVRQAIVAKLDDEVGDVRRAAVQALAGLVTSNAEVRQAIVAKLDGAAEDVRRAAVQVLAGLVASDAAVYQAIVAKLDDVRYGVRSAAVLALAELVASDAGIRQTIVAKLNDNADEVRRAAVQALAGLVASDAVVRQAIITKLNDEAYGVRSAAVLALAELVASDAGIRQTIVAKLNDNADEVRRAAVQALAGLVASDAVVRQAIITKLNDEAYGVRSAAVLALAGLVASDAGIRQTIVAKLNDNADEVRRAAVQALAGLVASDAVVRQAIITKLNDESFFDNVVQQAAIQALTGIVVSDATVRQAIVAKLDDRDKAVRQAAVQALTGIVVGDATVRQAIVAKLDSERYYEQQAAVQALTGLVASDATVRQAIVVKLDDEAEEVRSAAVQALTGLVASDEEVRQAIVAKLDDVRYGVRQVAVRALVEAIHWDANLAQRLLPWLGTVTEHYPRDFDPAREVKRMLSNAYATLAVQHPAWLAQIANLLTSFSWETREGAAWTCIAMPGGPPATLRPALLGLLDDLHTEASWPERLQVCAIFLNARDRELSTRAITLALEALDYATQPWYDLPRTGPRVRQQAAHILGQLEPLYYDERIFVRLARVLTEDNDADVRDAAYQALLRLAVAPEEVPQHMSAALVVEVEILQGGSMVVGKLAELVLQVHNRGHETLPKVDIQLVESAEYDIASANPMILSHLAPQRPQQVTFSICPKVTRLLPLNYTVNRTLRTLPLSVNVIHDNPYVYGNPIGPHDVFFGRQRELEDILQAVRKPNKQDILLVGERRAGKSSLLYQAHARLAPPFLPIYVVLNEAAAQVDAVIELLCIKVIHRLIEYGALVDARWSHYACSYDLKRDLRAILDAAQQRTPDLKLVLFLDEADYLLQIEDRLQNLLRALLQSQEVGDNIRVVVAGTTDLSTYITQRSSPFYNHFRSVLLKPLGQQETDDLITKPAARLRYTYRHDATTRIRHASGGHPYYCQRLCYEAFSLAIDTADKVVTSLHAEEAVQKVLQDIDAYRSFVSSFWHPGPPRQPLGQDERHFLQALAHGKSTKRFSRQTVERLLNWQLIKEHDSGYTFTCELFREWTRRAAAE